MSRGEVYIIIEIDFLISSKKNVIGWTKYKNCVII